MKELENKKHIIKKGEPSNTQHLHNAENAPTFMPKRTFILIGLLTVVTIILLITALYPSFSGIIKTTFNKAEPTVTPLVKAPKTTLTIAIPTLLPATDSIRSNSYTTDVLLSTDRKEIVAVDLELTFDPKVLGKVDIAPSAPFANAVVLRKNIDTVNGTITFVFGIAPGQKPVTTQGSVATITFTPSKTNGWSILEFAPNSKVISTDKVQSVLTGTNGIQFPFGIAPTQ